MSENTIIFCGAQRGKICHMQRQGGCGECLIRNESEAHNLVKEFIKIDQKSDNRRTG